ncbi:methylmalonyl Co-A mutase-associated GTPase MeaB [Maribacter sp.]|nr:methylmalonyl Co-A mutase-associated GTPase MeaB [Maribacter sp.]
MAESKNTHSKNATSLADKRKALPNPEVLAESLMNGDKAALARAITLVESALTDHWEIANSLIEKCLAKKNDSVRVGITGVPGVGKSTFIETLGGNLTAKGKKVAVLAVDPTSSKHKGSILGDKTRMAELSRDANAFIRPSPSGTSLGGVARKTRETIILCEAAGYDVILVETVGVGQSETAVSSMVDFFLLLKLAGAGDELQGIKRGIIEMADAIVINKADGANIKSTKSAAVEFRRALQLYPPKDNGWIPKVTSCSALHNSGIHETWDMVEAYVSLSKKDGNFGQKRAAQNENWLVQTIDDYLKTDFYSDKRVQSRLSELTKEVIQNKVSPFRAAELLLRLRKNETK